MRSVFVRAVGGEFASLGIGKQVDRQGDSCSVEYFDSPTSEAIVRTVDARSVEPVALAEQTRVYHFDQVVGVWEIGRRQSPRSVPQRENKTPKIRGDFRSVGSPDPGSDAFSCEPDQ